MPEIIEAILSLRQKLGLSQKAFGELLKVSTKTVLRYESGQQPSRKVLLTLARMSGKAEMNHLAELFTATRDKQIAELASTGSAPRIPKKELVFWEAQLKQIPAVAAYMIAGMRSGVLTTEYAVSSLEAITQMAQGVSFQMKPYLVTPAAQIRTAEEQLQAVKDHVTRIGPEAETNQARIAAKKINERNREHWGSQDLSEPEPTSEGSSVKELTAAPIQKRVPTSRKKRNS